MANGTTHEYLVLLRDTILKEREYAMQLDLPKMAEVAQEKEELIRILNNVRKLTTDDKEIAAEIRYENRRNAYLFKSTLGWIRETMEFFGKRSVTSTYTSEAGTVSSQVHGRLLSGKI